MKGEPPYCCKPVSRKLLVDESRLRKVATLGFRRMSQALYPTGTNRRVTRPVHPCVASVAGFQGCQVISVLLLIICVKKKIAVLKF